jgi:transglutaminase-like putative cysteine protease
MNSWRRSLFATVNGFGINPVRVATVLAVWCAIGAGLPEGRAANADRYQGSKWDLLDRGQMLAAAKEITLEKYPDCDEATVDKRLVRVYRPDGTGESQDETYTKVLTEKGKRNNRTLSLSFMLPYFTVEVVKLEVIKPDGTAEAVDVAANSKETIDDSQMAMNIFDPNNKILKVNIPKVEIGDVVHSVTRTTIERPIVAGEAAEWTLLEGPGFIRHMSYEIWSPNGKPLKKKLIRDEIPGTVKYSTRAGEGDTTVHVWEAANVPQMFDEPAMPPYEMVLQRLLVSTTPDWQFISRWYWELSKPHLDATSPDMKTQVDELVAKATTDLEKVKAVFYYVSKKVRYMGLTPEKDRPGFEPHDVKLTFEKKYGVCRDKAALLVSMLRAADLKAYPVLISVGSKRDPEVADPFFNHAIVAVEMKPGDYLLMDPTDENTRELLPDSECDQTYLVCRPEGEGLKVSPVNPPEQNMMKVSTVATLDAAGRLTARSDLAFDGINDNSYRQAFAHMKPDDQRRFFERALKQAMPGVTLKSLKLMPENMLDVSQAVRAHIEFTVDGMTASGNGKAMVSLPWVGKNLGIINFILGGAGLEKRKYPMQTYVACGLREEMELSLADGFTGAVSMPTCSPVEDSRISYQQSFKFADHKLLCARELKLKVVEFNPAEYLQLKQTLEALEYDERKAPVLAVSGKVENAEPSVEQASLPTVESNARVLESNKEIEILDAHTSKLRIKYRKEILTYAGKIREAEVKIDYNPACQEARLVRAVVTSKTGQKQEISKDEINIMDAGWNASAKRYTGGKVLVANLPGVDIGSTIEVELEITTKGKPFVSGWESFQLPDELETKQVRLTAPADLKIAKFISGEKGGVSESLRKAEGKQEIVWQANHVKAVPAEPQLPPEWVYLNGAGYFVGDLKTYLKELERTMVSRSEKRAKAEVVARELVAKAKNRTEGVKAIRDFVAKSIRGAGPSFLDLPLSELSDADVTLRDGYGHAADRAILLHALLSAAGFKPEIVLASGMPPIPEIEKVVKAFPLPLSFQSALVRATVDGVTYFLNDTDQYAQLGSTPADGKLAFGLARQELEVIHAAPGCADRSETEYALKIGDDGNTQLSVTRRFYGTQFNGKNRFFSELPPEERRRYFQQVVSGVSQSARPVGDLVTKFDSYPGVEQFTVDVEQYAVVDGNYLYFSLPFGTSLFPAGADSRELPLYVAQRNQWGIKADIDLPAGFERVTVAPGTRRFESPKQSGEAKVSAKQGKGKYSLVYEMKTAPAVVPAKEYPAMLKVESALARKSSRVFLLERQ